MSDVRTDSELDALAENVLKSNERKDRLRAIAGIGLYILSMGIFLGLGSYAGYAKAASGLDSSELYFILLIAVAFSLVFWRLGKGLRTPGALSILGRDLRPPVVFLRPESRDDVVDARVSVSGLIGSFAVGLGPFFPDKTQGPNERLLIKELKELGPVIALGRAGEVWRPHGAARLYTRNSCWQSVVELLLQRACLVCLVPGKSPGICWEMEAIVSKLQPDRCLILPADDDPDMLNTLNEVLPHPIDDPLYGLESAVRFDQEWSPHSVSLERSGWSWAPGHSQRARHV